MQTASPASRLSILALSIYQEKRRVIIGTAKVFRPAGAERKTSQMIRSAVYGEGEVLTLMSVFVSVLVAGDGLTIVVFVSFFSVFSAGGLVTVVSFSLPASKTTAPIKRQMHFVV